MRMPSSSMVRSVERSVSTVSLRNDIRWLVSLRSKRLRNLTVRQSSGLNDRSFPKVRRMNPEIKPRIPIV